MRATPFFMQDKPSPIVTHTMKLTRISKVLALCCAATLLAQTCGFAQELVRAKNMLVVRADESQTALYLKLREEQDISNFFDIYYDLLELDKKAKAGGENAEKYGRILEACVKRLSERENAGDIGAKVVKLALFRAADTSGGEYEKELLKLADAGDPKASYAVSLLYGSLSKPAKTRREYERSAALGGINTLIADFLRRAVYEKNFEDLAIWIPLIESLPKNNCKLFLKYHQYYYACDLLEGKKLPRDAKEATRILNLLSDKDFDIAQVFLYLLHTESPWPELIDADAAERAKTRALEKNAGGFHYNLAVARETGNPAYKFPFEIKQDTAEANRLLEKAAEAGYPDAVYSLALLALNPEQKITNRNLAREQLAKATLEGQKKAIKLFENFDFDANPNYSPAIYASIYIAGAEELRDIKKGIGIMEKYAVRNAWTSPLPVLYAMTYQGETIPRDNEKMAEYVSQAEIVMDNIGDFYNKVSGLFKKDGRYDESLLLKPNIDDEYHFAKLAALNGYKHAISNIAYSLLSDKKYQEAKEFLKKVGDKADIDLKLYYANLVKDADFYLSTVKDAIDKKVPVDKYADALAFYLALAMKGKNKNLKDPEEISKIMEDAINSLADRDDNPRSLNPGMLHYAIYRNLKYKYEYCGMEIPQDRKLALQYLAKSAEAGYYKALREMSESIMGNIEEAGTLEKAVEYEKKFLDMEESGTSGFISEYYTRKALEYNPAPIIGLFEHAAAKGMPYALLKLSMICEDGKYAKKDEAKAKEYRERALKCRDEKRLAAALSKIASESLNSESSFQKNPDRSVSLLLKAAELGSEESVFTLLRMYTGKKREIDATKLTLDIPGVAALKEGYAKDPDAPFYADGKIPAEIADEMFRLAMKSERAYSHSPIGELFLCLSKGLGGLDRDAAKADALKERFESLRIAKDMRDAELSWLVYGGDIVKADLSAAIGILEKTPNLTKEDKWQLENIKRILEENNRLKQRLYEIMRRTEKTGQDIISAG